ncbi:MAG: glycine--tRNA ligase subunit beta [Kofleriaceae bacterium]|nr:glycine--tRNA ligase subunit beta [Kofleriaceae bacterium]
MDNEAGELTNRFITIAGTVTRDIKVVQRGNERVLAARLSDAQFFFSEDKKRSLDEFASKLGDVVFQKKLGSTGQKVERIAAGAASLAAELGVDAKLVARAAALCKADLTSQMVGEFPELQGTMGRRYATLAGEPEEVATAIEEHYLPRGASDALPTSEVAAVVGLADRLDTIAGCFSIGVIPTGSADPFGLRRAALGILRLLTEREWKVDLSVLVARAVKEVASQQSLKADLSAVEGKMLEFLRVRFRGILTDGRGLPADCVDAALSVGYYDPRDARARAEAVAQLRERDDFEPLAAAFKRVANILKGQSSAGEPSVDSFVEEAERDLWSAFQGIEKRVETGLLASDYVLALTVLSELKAPVDSFFDSVMVMDEDETIRANRLAMLSRINHTFTKIADFRQLAV